MRERMRVTMLLVLAGLLLGLAATPARAAEPGKITIRFSHELPESHDMARGARLFAERVAKRTGGQVEVQVFPAAQLVKDVNAPQAVTTGTVDALMSPLHTWTSLVALVGVFDVPFLFGDWPTALKILEGDAGQRLLRKVEPLGAVAFGYMPLGFGVFSNNKRPVRLPQDFKGLKIRGANIVVDRLIADAGGVPTLLSPAELYMAMQRGVIDGSHQVIASTVVRKFYEVQKYLTVTRHNFVPYFMVMNRRVWDRLSPSQQEAVREAAQEAAKWAAEADQVAERDAVAFLRGKGMEVHVLTADEQRAWREVGRGARELWLSKVGREGAEIVQSIEAMAK